MTVAKCTEVNGASEVVKGDQKGRKGGIKGVNSGQSNIFKIANMIMQRNFAQVIIFSFNKKDCEVYAMQMAKLNFNTADEKQLVDEIFNNALDALSEEDCCHKLKMCWRCYGVVLVHIMGPPVLNPITEMHIKDADFKNIVDSIHKLEERLFGHPLRRSSNTSSGYTLYKGKLTVLEQLKIVETKLKEARSLLQMDKLKFRKRVLRRVQYCIAAEVIEFKGRWHCCRGLYAETIKCTEEHSSRLRSMQELARRLAKISTECKLELDEEAYVEKFKPFLMDVVLAWCKGPFFLSVCKMTDIFEGSIIRRMRCLEELLRQICEAGK
ncbi:hypothetical protein GQX74_014064 [Glossina fuscipes]|nr:hypothetical protein GQX74_014064 [Glossina fuscipes]